MPGADTKQLQLQISASSELMIRALKQADAGLADFQRTTERHLDAVDGRFARVGSLGLPGLQKGVEGVKSSLLGLATAAAGALSIGALSALTRQGLDFASSLGETAQQLGVSSTALQQYRYIATQVGIDQETIDGGLQKLTRSIGMAAEGSKKQAAAFAALGVSVRGANGEIRSTDDVLPELVKALSAMTSPAQRAALEVALFGKSGQALDTLLAGGIDQVNNLKKAAADLGLVLSEDQIANADQTADKLAELKQVLAANIAGVVANNAGAIYHLVDALEKLSVQARNTAGEYRGAFAAFAQFSATPAGRSLATGADRASRFLNLASPQGLILAGAKQVAQGFRGYGQAPRKVYPGQDAATPAAMAALARYSRSYSGTRPSAPARSVENDDTGAGRARGGGARRGRRSGAGGAARNAAVASFDVNRLREQFDRPGLGDTSRDAIDSMFHASSRDFTAGLDSANDKVRESIELYRDGMEELRQRNPLAAIQLELHAATDSMSEALQGVAARGLGSLEDGLLDVLDGTKSLREGFSDMARSILHDLERLAVQKAIVAALDAVLPGSGDFLGLLSRKPTKAAEGGPIKLAGGGRVWGPGGPRADRIPAMLSAGEYVINAAAYRENPLLVEAINAGRLPRLATGGPALADLRLPVMPSIAPRGGGDSVPVHVTIAVKKGEAFDAEVLGVSGPHTVSIIQQAAPLIMQGAVPHVVAELTKPRM